MENEEIVDQMERMLYSEVLFENVRTYLLVVIELIRSSLYKIDTLNIVLYYLPVSLQKFLRSALINEKSDLKKSESLLNIMRDKLLEMKKCRVRTARLPLLDDRMRLSTGLRKILGEDLVIDLVVDDDLLAGVVIECDGKIYDYSLSKYL